MYQHNPDNQPPDNSTLSPKGPAPMRRVPAPAPEYVGPTPNIMHNADGSPMLNTPKGICIHGTVGPCTSGQRYAVARELKNPALQASANYICDPGGVVQLVWDAQVADHCGVNPDTLGIELTMELPSPAWDLAHKDRWTTDPDYVKVLTNGARLTAKLCRHYGIPIRRTGPNEFRAWVEGGRKGALGIFGHDTVTAVYPADTAGHWDPGPAFPWGHFMSKVQGHALYLDKKARGK